MIDAVPSVRVGPKAVLGADIATSRMRRSVPSARILPLVASFLFIVRLGAGKGGRLQPNASEKALGGKK
jgi:hypothetical protein